MRPGPKRMNEHTVASAWWAPQGTLLSTFNQRHWCRWNLTVFFYSLRCFVASRRAGATHATLFVHTFVVEGPIRVFFLSSHICFYGICLVVNKYLKKNAVWFFFCITLLLRDLLGSISNKFCKVVIGESLNTWPKACASATKVRVPKVNLSRKRLMRRSALAFLFAATDGTLFVHEALLSCNRHIFYILDSKQHSSIRFRTRRNLHHHHHGHYQQAGLGMFGSLACARKL